MVLAYSDLEKTFKNFIESEKVIHCVRGNHSKKTNKYDDYVHIEIRNIKGRIIDRMEPFMLCFIDKQHYIPPGFVYPEMLDKLSKFFKINNILGINIDDLKDKLKPVDF